MADVKEEKPLYERIYDIVRQVPEGKVTTYGQVARITGGCTARMVGYAMSALRSSRADHADVPWHRVINSQGKVSVHGAGIGTDLQRQMLIDEGVAFNDSGRVDFSVVGWGGLDGKTPIRRSRASAEP